MKEKGVPHRLHLFGTYEAPVGMEYDRYLYKPKPDQLREFYNEVDFWIAPTKKEGLHIPPQEAMLCGCILIGTGGKAIKEDYELSGMHDYLTPNKTGFTITQPDRAVAIIRKFHTVKEARYRLEQISEAGKDRIRGLGNREINMERMVQLFEKVIEKMKPGGIGNGGLFDG